MSNHRAKLLKTPKNKFDERVEIQGRLNDRRLAAEASGDVDALEELADEYTEMGLHGSALSVMRSAAKILRQEEA